MSHCLNPNCARPQNPDAHRFCASCGGRLRLGDRYEAVHPLGTGRNSGTFLGRDRHTLVQPQCLIKVFTPVGTTRAERATATERFRQMVQMLDIASQHPQIPNLLGYFERGDRQMLVLQFVAGETLAQTLARKAGPWDAAEVEAWLREVLPLVHYLHQHQIVHRDLKPQNFRKPPGSDRWWLVDLGAAKPLDPSPAQPGTVIGSAEYAAPEQLRGEATEASDLYSLGVICLHLLTGLSPFALFDGVQGCWRWRSIVPDVPDTLATLLDGLVEPTLRDRCPSAAVAMQRLGMPILSVATPTVEQRVTVPWSPAQTQSLAPAIALAAASGDRLIALAPDGTWVAPPAPARSPPLPLPETPIPYASAIAISPDGHTLAIGTRHGDILRWRWRDSAWRAQSAIAALGTAVTALAFTPSGEELISASDRTLTRWAAGATLPRPLGQQDSPITAIAINTSGELASGDRDGRVVLWHLGTGEMLRTLTGHQGAISALGWTAQDTILVSAAWDMTLWWRQASTGGIRQRTRAAGFALPIRAITANAAGRVLTGSQDGSVQYWPTPNQGSSTAIPYTTARLSGPIARVMFLEKPGTTGDRSAALTQGGQWAEFDPPILAPSPKNRPWEPR